MTLITPDFSYDCAVVRVVDGDTFDADLSRDVGFRCRPVWRWRLRLLGVNCPEISGPTRPAGLAASDFARQWLAAQPTIAITHSQDNFGRWLATICRADGSSLADALVDSGHAVRVP